MRSEGFKLMCGRRVMGLNVRNYGRIVGNNTGNWGHGKPRSDVLSLSQTSSLYSHDKAVCVMMGGGGDGMGRGE